MKTNLKLGIVLLCFFPTILSAAIIYVNPAASGSNLGTSWINAYTSLSTALSTAGAGDEIWVRQGVYKPVTFHDVNGNGATEAREVTFKIPSGVALYGGFTGTEVTRAERNHLTNMTILSGDIDNNDVNLDGNFIAENTGQLVGNNAYHVIYTQNVSAVTRLDGFVVTAGRAVSAALPTDPNQDGGAWYNLLNGALNASSPTLVNSTFQGNYAASEGGAFFGGGSAAGGAVTSLIENCRFIANQSNFAGGAIYIGSFQAGNYQPQIRKSEFNQNEAFRRGGAIYLIGDHAVLDSTWFRSNKVTAVSPDNSTLPGSGGGVGMVASNASFSRCYFDGNMTTGNPTGPFEGGGGAAVYMSTSELQTNTLGISQPKFVNCGFYSNVASGNVAAWGGAAVHLSDGGKLKPSYIGCVFANNHAQNDGGAVANFARVISVADGFNAELTPLFTNCTFTGNSADKNGGAIYYDGYVYLGVEVLSATIRNSILWGNTAGVSGPQIALSGTNSVAYSLVQGSGGSGAWNGSAGTNDGNNIDASPGFVNAADPDGADNTAGNADDGLRLNATAAPVEAGDINADGLSGITSDFAGGNRVQGSKIDMGAYEIAGTPSQLPKKFILKEWRPVRPLCVNCPWAFVFNERIFQKFVWNGRAQLVEDGRSAVITGKIVSLDNQDAGFDVNLKLVNKRDWNSWSALGRIYAAFSFSSIFTAITYHYQWTFWELSNESYLKGTGDFSGQLNLVHAPYNRLTGFQLGRGANGWDADFGMSGSFTYKGTLKHRGMKINVSGAALMNVDAEEKSGDTKRLASTIEKEFAPVPSPDEPAMTVFPNPVRGQLNVRTWATARRFVIKLVSLEGIVMKQSNEVPTGRVIILSVKDLTSGSYIVQLYGDDGIVESRQVVVE